jgi:riboflavin synthase
MFTGLIDSTGTVLNVLTTDGATRLIIAAPSLAGRWHMGDSIAVNGVCLTALDVAELDEKHPGRFAADLAAETVERTTLAHLTPGALVNLELPTPSGAPLGGHVVQGHVDTTGTLVSLIALHPDIETTDWRLTVDLPASLAAYVVPQGSITIDGISLTVAKLTTAPTGVPRVEIAVIPHTYRATNLRSLLAGAQVNVETDVLGKYAERRAFAATTIPATTSTEWLTPAYLMERGY